MEDYERVYPQVPQVQVQNGENFRLQKSCELLQSMEKEISHYDNVRKKYSRARSIFSKVGVGSGMLSVILSASGLGTSLTGFGVIVGVPLGSLGGLCGGISVGCVVASKRLSLKVSKHEQTVALAKAKVNTIRDLVSKAMRDNVISDQEFSLILAEVDNFERLKLEIRQKMVVEKKEDMTQIRREVRAELLKELTAPGR